MTALIRQGLDELLPRRDLAEWLREARRQRTQWKTHGVAMEARRPLLLQALNRLYSGLSAQSSGLSNESRQPSALSPAEGHVSLVGAGPGDPSLLTRKAIARLRTADLVLYDALIDERILRYARHAQRFFVGKRQGRHALPQDKINALMVRAARRGRRVVRLKGGDPFVLGRGGEEAIALASAGVAFEVVPGVTSAIAAPALAGIPVTHRGLASAFYVVSGHDEETFDAAVREVPTTGLTLVVLMGLAKAGSLAARLVARGWAAQTPAAVVVDASTARQQVWRGTLDDLAGERATIITSGPGTIVVGDVVSVAETLWQPQLMKPSSPPTAARG